MVFFRDVDGVSDCHDAACEDSCESALARHDAVSDYLPDGAVGVTGLADLGDLEEYIGADAELCADGEVFDFESAKGEVFGEGAVAYGGVMDAEALDAFPSKKADLARRAGVSVALEAVAGEEPSALDVALGRSLFGACADGNYLGHGEIPPVV